MSSTGSVPPKIARGGLVHVVVTGSECTGKTTLATQLAAHYGVEHVPEFVREFARTVGGRLQFSDHGPIARGQIALEDEHSARASDIVIHDTDLVSTVVYCRHYFGRCPEWVEAAAADRRRDVYLVCDIDVPWVPDGIRDRGDRRDEMHKLFVTTLSESGVQWEIIRGDESTRLRRAKTLIDALRH